jgi:hypothetical protein
MELRMYVTITIVQKWACGTFNDMIISSVDEENWIGVNSVKDACLSAYK